MSLLLLLLCTSMYLSYYQDLINLPKLQLTNTKLNRSYELVILIKFVYTFSLTLKKLFIYK